MRQLSLIQFERGLEIVADVDLTPIFEGWQQLQATGSLQAMFSGEKKSTEEILQEFKVTPELLQSIGPILKTLGRAGKAKVLRRLAAVALASDDELEAAEGSSEKLAALESSAARLGVIEGLVGAFSFFARLGLSPAPSPGSSEEGAGEADAAAPAQGGDTPSGDS